MSIPLLVLNRATVILSWATAMLLVLGALLLAGCWTLRTANVQPKGEPRLIQGAIRVESIKYPAIVESVDPGSRTLVMLCPGDPAAITYQVAPRVRNLERIKAGDELQVTIVEELTVYILRDGRLPIPGATPEPIAAEARVQSADASYRLLTVQFPNGTTETFKVGRQARLDEMGPGDAIVIRPVEVIALRVRK